VKRRQKKDEKKLHVVAARFGPSALAKLEREALKQDRSRSEVVRRLVERALDCSRDDC
jgi:hypothetical protein